MVAKINVVVPQKYRSFNEVDKLQEEIKRIQSACEHDFLLLEQKHLLESCVSGTFIAHDQYKHSLKEETFGVKCLKCSLEKTLKVTDTCPQCLGKMAPGELEDSRKKYLGHDYLYYCIRHYHCTKCELHAVADEWDQ